MKTVLIILFLFSVSIIILIVILGINSRSKDAVGLVEGVLSKCPDTPNCVCTETKDQIAHYISPINIPQNTTPSINYFMVLKDTVQNMGGIIQTEKENYFSATFSSPIFGFADDLEIRIDIDKKVIHIRSASRVGRSDLGVNKKRVELLKEIAEKKIIELSIK